MHGGQICVLWLWGEPQLLVVLGRVPGAQCGLCTLQTGLGAGESEHLGYQSTWIGIWGFFVHFFLIWKWEGLGCG